MSEHYFVIVISIGIVFYFIGIFIDKDVTGENILAWWIQALGIMVIIFGDIVGIYHSV